MRGPLEELLVGQMIRFESCLPVSKARKLDWGVTGQVTLLAAREETNDEGLN